LHWCVALPASAPPLACLAAARPLSCAASNLPAKERIDAEDQGEESRRRARWRRDDPDHLELIKNKLILPYLDVDLKYYGLGMESRRDALTSVRQDRP
jgi:hypothetical protein